MFEPQKRRRFLRAFFNLSKLEEHFLELLRRMLYVVYATEGEAPRFIVFWRRRPGPYIEMAASLGRKRQVVTLQVHGLKPVRYHIQTANTALGRKLRRTFSMALGEDNLDVTASNQTGRRLSLVYHVYYPEEVLRQLGS